MSKKTIFYLILFSGLLLGLVAFFTFKAQIIQRKLSIILTALFYFCWGMVYHKWEKTLHPRVIIEYLLIAALGALLLLSITW